jgi:hypothetical protein
MVELTGELVDAVDVGRHQRMLLVDRQIARRTVDLPCAGEHETRVGRHLAAGFEQVQLRFGVDGQVRERIGHGIEVAGLADQIEDDVATADQVGKHVAIAQVGQVDRDALGDPLEVEPVAAVLRDQAVDDQDIGAESDQAAGQCRADEAKSAGNQHLAAMPAGVPGGRRIARRVRSGRAAGNAGCVGGRSRGR